MRPESQFKTLVDQTTLPGQLQIEWHPGKRETSAGLESRVQKHWQKQVAATAKSGYLFDGALCSLLNWRLAGGRLCLRLGPTSYKELLYSNFCQTQGQESPDNFNARALGVSLVLTSVDDHIILIRRSQLVGEAPGQLDVVGGHIHPGEHVTGGRPSPYLAIIQEMEEEVGIRPALNDICCLGLLETTHTRKPEMVFLRRGPERSSDILETAAKTKSCEITELLTLQNSKTTLFRFLESRVEEISPSCTGSLWLYANQMA